MEKQEYFLFSKGKVDDAVNEVRNLGGRVWEVLESRALIVLLPTNQIGNLQHSTLSINTDNVSVLRSKQVWDNRGQPREALPTDNLPWTAFDPNTKV